MKENIRRKRVYLTRNLLKPIVDQLQKSFEIHIRDQELPPTEDELIQECQGFDAIVSLLTDPLSEKVLSSCPDLKYISQYAAGSDNIDREACTRLKIKVGTTPDVLTQATAELGLTLLMNLARKIPEAQRNVQDKKWKTWGPQSFLGTELKGKTLGVVGLGRIGACFAQMAARAFEMPVLYTSRSDSPFEQDFSNIKKVKLETVLKESDIVSLHCPLTQESAGLFDQSKLRLMKKGSFLINTARGGLIHHQDLWQLIQDDHFAGVALDVTDPEPFTHPMIYHPKVLVTPHIGSATHTARLEMGHKVIQNLHDFFYY